MKTVALSLFCLASIMLLFPSSLPAPGPPCISVTKACVDQTNSNSIPFSGTVTNCSPYPVDVTSLKDDNGTPADTTDDFEIFVPAISLAAGESRNFSGVWTPATSPSTNTVTAVANYSGTLSQYYPPVTASATATCTWLEATGCRVTGGGNATAGIAPDGGWDGTLALGKFKKGPAGFNRYTFGGQAGANTALPPQPQGNWEHHQQFGPDGAFGFHGNVINVITCSDPGFCDPARANADFKQIDFAGLGVIQHTDGTNILLPKDSIHWFEVHIEDLGEPGNKPRGVDLRDVTCPPEGSLVGDCACPDFYSITIYAGETNASEVAYRVYGYLSGGNLQIHPPTGFDMK